MISFNLFLKNTCHEHKLDSLNNREITGGVVVIDFGNVLRVTLLKIKYA
ncbi:MAG: hypothetical protein ACI84K_000462 [Pseudohongiellaceae bacterium]|jgi:hypothetical protein